MKVPTHKEIHNCQAKKKFKKKQAFTCRNQAFKQYGQVYRVYKCPICKYYHLTSKGEGI